MLLSTNNAPSPNQQNPYRITAKWIIVIRVTDDVRNCDLWHIAYRYGVIHLFWQHICYQNTRIFNYQNTRIVIHNFRLLFTVSDITHFQCFFNILHISNVFSTICAFPHHNSPLTMFSQDFTCSINTFARSVEVYMIYLYHSWTSNKIK